MKRAILLGAALAFTLGAQGAPNAQTIAPASTDPVAAVVNGKTILGSDVKAMFDGLPEKYREYPLEMLYKQLLQQLIDQKLVVDAARKEGLLNDPEIQRRIAFVTESTIQEIYTERLIKDKIDDRALRAAYAERRGGGGEQEVHARHILLKTEAEALVIIKRLQGGADFAKTAAAKSIGPSRLQGGDLGFFAFGQMVPPFSRVAFKLKPGEFSVRPVKTQFGWHIIKVEARRRAGVASFEESAEELRNELVEQLVAETMERLRANANIRVPQGGNIQRVQ